MKFMKYLIPFLAGFLCISTAYSQNTVYVIHGYGATVYNHWFKYIKHNLEDSKTSVTLISLPDSNNPNLEEWKQTIDSAVKNIDDKTYFVAHSLGCITLLDYLSKAEFKEAAGLACVAGFSDRLPAFPQVDSYIDSTKIDFTVNSKFKNKMMFISSNDPSVPPKLSEELAKKLESNYQTIPNAGHFLDREGYGEFPQLLDWLKKTIK